MQEGQNRKRTKLEILEERRHKATLAVRQERSKDAKRKRRERDTAIFTIGGTFVALLENPNTREMALKIWDGYLAKQSPGLFTDNRRSALKSQFGLDPKE